MTMTVGGYFVRPRSCFQLICMQASLPSPSTHASINLFLSTAILSATPHVICTYPLFHINTPFLPSAPEETATTRIFRLKEHDTPPTPQKIALLYLRPSGSNAPVPHTSPPIHPLPPTYISLRLRLRFPSQSTLVRGTRQQPAKHRSQTPRHRGQTATHTPRTVTPQYLQLPSAYIT